MVDSKTLKSITQHEYVILVTASPKYAHLIPTFKLLTERFWPGFEATFDVAREGESWTDQMARAVAGIPTSIFLRLSEEFFIHAPVDLALVEEAFKVMRGDPSLFRIGLQGVDEGYRNCSKQANADFFELNKDAEYLCSLEASFFRRDKLLAALTPGLHIWEAEADISRKLRESKEPVLVTKERAIPYKDAFRQGQARIKEVDGVLMHLVPGDTWEPLVTL